MTPQTALSSRPARALVVIAGDDVYEDLFTASLKLQQLLVHAGIAARTMVGTARLAAAAEADLVVLYSALGLFPDVCQEALADAVAGGTGLIAVHSASVYPQSAGGATAASHATIAGLIGCRFISHGPQPHESRFTVRSSGLHAVTRGLAPFDITHEHYHLEVVPAAEVIAWRLVAPGVGSASEPLCCVRHFGAGRVCYLQPGHDMRIWDEPGVRELFARAARWACRPAEPGEAA